jgi:hypothetical protein
MRCVLLLILSQALAIGHEVGAEMTEAAGEFLNSLEPAQRARAELPFGSDERLNWRFVPAERLGLPLGAMTEPQRNLARRLMRSALSADGARKAETIQNLESVLASLEKGRGPVRDPNLYHLTVFGVPGPKGAWAWRLEGHHLEVQVTLLDGQPVGLTPHFMGANPGKVAAGPLSGTEVLADEDTLGRALALTLDKAQREIAVIPGKVPADILSGATRVARPLEPRGITLAQLGTPQRELFWQIVSRFVGRFRGELADPVLAELRALPADQLSFAWSGGMEVGEGHYYRIQAPSLLLELDNTQNNANHVHTVWRDLRNDFGGDALRRHLKTEHAGH